MEVFSRREVAQDFLGHYLPEPVAALVDFTSLQLAKDTFVDAALQPHYSDLLYQMRLVDGQAGYVYVLFEPKSYPDPLTPFQLLRYLVRLWEQELRQGAERLSPVIPLVVYHGRRAWPGKAHFGALFAGPEALYTILRYVSQASEAVSEEGLGHLTSQPGTVRRKRDGSVVRTDYLRPGGAGWQTGDSRSAPFRGYDFGTPG